MIPRPPADWGRHVVHLQVGSRGVKSLAKAALRMLRVPVGTMALPKR